MAQATNFSLTVLVLFYHIAPISTVTHSFVARGESFVAYLGEQNFPSLFLLQDFDRFLNGIYFGCLSPLEPFRYLMRNITQPISYLYNVCIFTNTPRASNSFELLVSVNYIL